MSPVRPPADAADAPTVVAEVIAPKHWRAIDFISDLHLAVDTPLAFAAWARYMQGTRADAVFILGDLFDAWPGDDARFDGFEARCAEVLRSASARRVVGFLPGNRDFLVGNDLLTECGMQALDDPCAMEAFGSRVLLSHGDAWCLADTDYLRFRAQVRGTAWKAAVLAQTLPQRRALARQLREQSEQQAQGRSPDDWADVDRPTALAWMRVNRTPTLLHGHTHRPATETLAPGLLRQVLSDWSLDHPTGARAEVLRWQADGLTRVSPAAAAH